LARKRWARPRPRPLLAPVIRTIVGAISGNGVKWTDNKYVSIF
jgi:hypothetical protein